MPSLNQGEYIGEAIRSVLAQRYPSFELIVIDGGSTDNSVQVIREFKDRLTYWCSEKDNGQSHAINKGLVRASGEIVTWLNSDDRYLPDSFSAAAELFGQHPGVAFIHGRAHLFGKGHRTRTIGPADALAPHLYLSYMRFPQPSSFFSKKALDAVMPLNEELHYCMDFELVARIILLNGRLAATAQLLSGYRLHARAKTAKEDQFLKEWSEVLLNIFDSISGGEQFSEKMQELGLDNRKKKSIYPSTRKFTEPELREVYLDHLNLHFHHYYKNLDRQRCENISTAIAAEDNAYAHKNRLGTYLFRLRYLSALLKLRRRLAA